MKTLDEFMQEQMQEPGFREEYEKCSQRWT